MEILKFIKKLLPRIERSTVSDDLRTTEKELVKIVIPCWASAKEHFKISKPISEEIKHFQALFVRSFDYRRAMKSPSFILDIEVRLKNLHANVVYIQSILDTVVDKDIMTSGMTMRAAYTIRAAANMSMMTRYLSSLLNYLYTVEAMARNNEIYDELKLSQSEMKYVEANFNNFVRLLSSYGMSPEDFSKTVSSMPESHVNARTADFITKISGFRDPQEEVGMAGFVGNPIYAGRLMIAQWQNDRYEAAKAKKQQLELRLMYLQMHEKGKGNPAVDKEIMMLQDRIDVLEGKLRDTDEELGI